MNRGEIEARARAQALVRDELARRDALQVELAALETGAGPGRRLAASLAGGRLWGLFAGDRAPGRDRSELERRGANLRRRRFRLSRRKRVLEAGPSEPLWMAAERLRRAPPANADHRADRENLGLPGRWGPAIRHRLLADRLAGPGGRRGRAARVLVGPACPGAVTDAVAELGLGPVDAGADADVTIDLDSAGELSFDWIGSGERSAASAAGLVERIGAGDGAAALLEALRASARAASFCIRIAGRDWESANRGGDAALARSLARALGARGHQAKLQVGAEAGDPLAQCLDVLLVLRGRAAGEPTPGRVSLLWQISHPDETEAAELNRYDRVLVASTRAAQRLQSTVGPAVEPLLQFTDPELFHPTPDSGFAHEVAFAGNWRGEFRRIVWDAIEAGHPPALYGRGWDLLAPEHAVAEHVPHDQLHRLYSSSQVLLCDHWEDMRRLGFVSNRVFDALACEAFVIADDNPALAEELPGAVETYSTPAELGAKLDRYLGDREARERMARRGRAIVLAEHTVGRRAEQLLAIAAAAARECGRPAVAHLRDLAPAGRPGEPGDGASAAAAAPRGPAAGRASAGPGDDPAGAARSATAPR